MQFSRSSRWTDKKWYLGVLCTKCAAPILFGQDQTEGRGPFQPPGRLLLTCGADECGHRAEYTADDVAPYQRNP